MNINRNRIDALLKTVGENDKARLTTLYNATVSTLKAYNQDSTAARLRDWQAAEKALAEAVEDAEGRPGTGQEDGCHHRHYRRHRQIPARKRVLRTG